MATDERPLRLCESCFKVDRDPRHVVGGAGEMGRGVEILQGRGYSELEQVVAQRDLTDSSTVLKHLDCCLADGCPDGSCNARLEDPADPFDGGKTRGDALVKKLVKFIDESGAAEPVVSNKVAVTVVKEQ